MGDAGRQVYNRKTIGLQKVIFRIWIFVDWMRKFHRILLPSRRRLVLGKIVSCGQLNQVEIDRIMACN